MIIIVIITITKSNLIRYYEHDVELVMENTKWQVQVKPKKMLKSREFSNCHEPLSQEWINGRYRTPIQYVT